MDAKRTLIRVGSHESLCFHMNRVMRKYSYPVCGQLGPGQFFQSSVIESLKTDNRINGQKDPDQTARERQFYLGLCCLQM